MKNPTRLVQQGFTLIELLIVAIMLAILAAIIIPQFSGTTDGAQDAALRSDLAGIRSAIAMYRQQHGEFPGRVASTGGTCPGGTVGTGALNTDVAFREQLSLYSNAAGQTCNVSNTNFPFGPYLGQSELPANPVTGSNTLVLEFGGNLTMVSSVTGAGWRYDVISGKFIADDMSTDNNLVRYDSY